MPVTFEQDKSSRKTGDLSEFATRKRYIDTALRQMGWKFDGADADVFEEYPVEGMAGISGQMGHTCTLFSFSISV